MDNQEQVTPHEQELRTEYAIYIDELPMGETPLQFIDWYHKTYKDSRLFWKLIKNSTDKELEEIYRDVQDFGNSESKTWVRIIKNDMMTMLRDELMKRQNARFKESIRDIDITEFKKLYFGEWFPPKNKGE